MSGDLFQLLDALISREHLPDVILSSELRAEIERQLVPVFDSGQPVVVWSGINEGRGDAVARSGAGEWRIVYLSSDGEHIDSLHVFQRPAPFHGVASGRAVVVNGPSGSAKSSLLEQLSATARSRGWSSTSLSSELSTTAT